MRDVTVKQSYPRERRIGGMLDVRSAARRLRHFACIEMRLMEAQASWLPFVPQAELKIELAYHIYDDAYHVQEIYHRLPEIGAFDQQFTPVNDRIGLFLNELTNTQDLIEQLAGLYWVLRPQLAAVYREHLAQDDTCANNPTARILDRALCDHERVTAWGHDLLLALAEPHELNRAEAWRDHLLDVLQWAGGILGEREMPDGDIPLRDPGTGLRFRKDPPARDSRFRVESYVRREGRAATDVWDAESLLKYMFMNVIGEIEATESCCRTLYDFPHMPWPFRFQVARQMWDEARHAELSLQRFWEMGGRLDMLPTRDTFPLYFGPTRHDDLALRLVQLNQVIEGWVTDDFTMMADISRGLGDERSARLFEYLIADEWSHIRIGAEWIPYLIKDNPDYRQRVMEYRAKAEATLYSDLDRAALEVAQLRETGAIPALKREA